MKASEAIRLALESHYGFCGDGTMRSEFMCHALEDLHGECPNSVNYLAVTGAKTLIQKEIGEGGSVLVSYLADTDPEYNKVIGVGHYHDTQCAYEYRVCWWIDFIERLELQGY